MLIKPFKQLLNEYKNKTNISYQGLVEDNNDPDQLGRLRVRISIYEDIPTDLLPWSSPLLPTFLGASKDSIMFSVPEIGSEVQIKFLTNDKYAPYYESAQLNTSNKCNFFDEDYPNTYGFKDNKGNFFKVNKKTNKITIQHSNTTNITISEEGLLARLPNGLELSMNNDEGSLEINAPYDITLNSNNVRINGNASLSTGATGVVSTMDGRLLTFKDGFLINIS